MRRLTVILGGVTAVIVAKTLLDMSSKEAQRKVDALLNRKPTSRSP